MKEKEGGKNSIQNTNITRDRYRSKKKKGDRGMEKSNKDEMNGVYSDYAKPKTKQSQKGYIGKERKG